jgi:predicted nucleotidyltransferase
MSRDEVIDKLSASIDDLRREYPLKSLSIFGSAARGEAGPESDVDILVEFNGPIGLFKYCRLAHRLEQILGRRVDLGTPNSLKPYLKDRVLQEAVRVA